MPNEVRERVKQKLLNLRDDAIILEKIDVEPYLTEIFSVIGEEIGKAKERSIYDFPKSYTNAQIIAYQKGVENTLTDLRARLEK